MPPSLLHDSRSYQWGISKTTKQATRFSKNKQKKIQVAHLSQQMTGLMNTATKQIFSFSKHFETKPVVGKRSPSFSLSSLKLTSQEWFYCPSPGDKPLLRFISFIIFQHLSTKQKYCAKVQILLPL